MEAIQNAARIARLPSTRGMKSTEAVRNFSSTSCMVLLLDVPSLNLRSTGNKSSISRATAITRREPRSRLGNIYSSLE